MNRHFLRLTKLCFVAILIFVVGNAASEDVPGGPAADFDATLADLRSDDPATCERGLQALPGFVRLRNSPPQLSVIVEAITAGLNHPQLRLRSAAADSAVEIAAGMPHLRNRFSFARILLDQDETLKRHVLWQCQNRGLLLNTNEIAILAQILPHSSTELRFVIYANFYKLGDTYVPGLNNPGIAWAGPAVLNMIDREIRENAIASTRGSVASQALSTLGRVGRGNLKCVPKLIAMYEQAAGDKERQREILNVIAIVGATNNQGLPFLMRLLEDRTASLADRSDAAGVIGVLGPMGAPAVSPMTDLLREAVAAQAPERVFRSIIGGLSRLGDAAEPAIPLLLTLAEGPEGSPATECALEAIDNLAPVAIDRSARVIASLLYRDNRYRLVQVQRLGSILARFHSAGLPYTIAALADHSSLVRSKAIATLRMCGPEAVAAVPALQRIVEERREGWKQAERLLSKLR